MAFSKQIQLYIAHENDEWEEHIGTLESIFWETLYLDLPPEFNETFGTILSLVRALGRNERKSIQKYYQTLKPGLMEFTTITGPTDDQVKKELKGFHTDAERFLGGYLLYLLGSGGEAVRTWLSSKPVFWAIGKSLASCFQTHRERLYGAIQEVELPFIGTMIIARLKHYLE